MTFELELQVIATALGAVASFVGIITLVFAPLIKKANERARAMELFLRDWSGEEASPGRDRVPGVMERLNKLDGEFKRNGGSTMKDAVSRIERSVKDVIAATEKQSSRLEAVEKRLAEHISASVQSAVTNAVNDVVADAATVVVLDTGSTPKQGEQS
jgi:hypothetical protein